VIAQTASRTDETVITLKPTEGVEYKIELPRGAQVQYSWSVANGVVNYDMYGTPGKGARRRAIRLFAA
jgi:hypothetical protein